MKRTSQWILLIVALCMAAFAMASSTKVMLGDQMGLDGSRSMCDLYKDSGDMSCRVTRAPLRISIIGERAECINTSPYNYPTEDEVIIALDTGDPSRSFKYRYGGFRQGCAEAVNVEVSVDGEWHNLGPITPTAQGQYEILAVDCSGPGCHREPLEVNAIRACDRYTGADCEG